jgi:methionyl-tRNA synthetase
MATAIFMNSIIPNKISSFWKEQLMLDKEPNDSSYWNSDISFPKKHRIGEAKPLFKRLDN